MIVYGLDDKSSLQAAIDSFRINLKPDLKKDQRMRFYLVGTRLDLGSPCVSPDEIQAAVDTLNEWAFASTESWVKFEEGSVKTFQLSGLTNAGIDELAASLLSDVLINRDDAQRIGNGVEQHYNVDVEPLNPTGQNSDVDTEPIDPTPGPSSRSPGTCQIV